MPERTVAEAFPPGEFIQDELESRGWSRTDLANIMGRPERFIDEIIAGERSVSPEVAGELGEAFGTGADFWLNLEASYRRHMLSQTGDHGNRRQEERQVV